MDKIHRNLESNLRSKVITINPLRDATVKFIHGKFTFKRIPLNENRGRANERKRFRSFQVTFKICHLLYSVNYSS